MVNNVIAIPADHVRLRVDWITKHALIILGDTAFESAAALQVEQVPRRMRS